MKFHIILNFQSFWTYIESKLNQIIPECIKRVLEVSGFDSEFALEALNEENLTQSELHVHSYHKDVINNLSCCHSDTYRMQEKFQFVPGHRAFILSLPGKLQANPNAVTGPVTLGMICEQLINRSSSLPMLTELLKEFLRTSVKNEHKSKTQFRYSEIIQYFSIYIYMISGRNSYEIMSNNLPMPTAQTVCELIFFFYLFLLG